MGREKKKLGVWKAMNALKGSVELKGRSFIQASKIMDGGSHSLCELFP